MIERFEVGKSYRWIGPKERPFTWNSEGRMDFLLDGKPHKVRYVENNGKSADFVGHRRDKKFNTSWIFAYTLDRFEEVI